MAVKKAKKKAAKVSAKEIAVGTTTEKYSAVKFSAERVISLHKEGKNVSQIAQACGYPPGHGNNRTRRVLVAAGLLSK